MKNIKKLLLMIVAVFMFLFVADWLELGTLAVGLSELDKSMIVSDRTYRTKALENSDATVRTVKSSGELGDGLFWELNDSGELVISGVGSMGEHYSEKTLPWYGNCAEIKTVIVESGVTEISAYAFYGCSELTSITLPDSVGRIGSSAFEGCSALNCITIPDGVDSVEYKAFYGCTGLTYVDMPSSITSINMSAFEGCSALVEIIIPEGVTGIGNFAFKGCSSMEKVEIPSSVTTIGNYAFDSCGKLVNVYISDVAAWCGISFGQHTANPLSTCTPNSTKNLYVNGELIKNLIIPEGVTSIPDYAFYYCEGLTSVSIPSSVTTIGDYAFYYCDSLTSVNIPASVTAIGNYVFEGCKNIIDVYISDIAAWCNLSFGYNANPICVNSNIKNIYLNGEIVENLVIPDGVSVIPAGSFSSWINVTSITIPDSVTTIGTRAFGGCIGVTSVTIPDSVTTIEMYAFSGCSGMTDITIGNGVETIGNYAFSECSGLTDITIGNSVKTIGEYAFKNCGKLATVSLPDGLEIINNYAFRSCYELKTITIPGSLTTIGDYAFYACNNLHEVYYEGDLEQWFDITFNMSPLSYGANLYLKGELLEEGLLPADAVVSDALQHCTSVKSIVISDAANTISDSAFYGCSALESVIIPDTVTVIGESAFEGCTNLTDVTLPAGITQISDRTFKGCGMAEVTIPEGVTSIGERAFEGCASIVKVSIPSSLESIGVYAFHGCSNLDDWYITDVAAWCEISFVDALQGNLYIDGKLAENLIIPEGPEFISARAFFGFDCIISVEIPEGVESIGKEAFYDCSNLVTVNIPSGVTDIGESAFAYTSIEEMVIPEGVTEIKGGTFAGCDLKRIQIPESVVSIGSGAFANGIRNTAEGYKVVIPKNVTEIGAGAFQDNFDINFLFEGDAPEIGDNAFDDCDAGIYYLKCGNGWDETITNTYGGNIIWLDYHVWEDNVCIYCGAEIAVESRGAWGDSHVWEYDNNYTLTVSGDGDMAAYNLSAVLSEYPYIETVVFCDGVTSISNGAFTDCIRLVNVELPEGLVSIGSKAFGGCINLENITIPDGVTTIGLSAFAQNEKLEQINIPSSIEFVGDGAFAYCSALEVVHISDLAAWCNIVFEAGDANPLDNGAKLYVNGEILINLNIPDGVINVCDYVFYDYDWLESVTMSKDVEAIGIYVFYGCSNLETVTVSSSVTELGRGAFGACSKLTEVYFLGNKPTFVNPGYQFFDVTATAYYPICGTGWGSSLTYGGNITWKSYHVCDSVCDNCGIEYVSSLNKAVDIIRNAMENREQSFCVYYYSETALAGEDLTNLVDIALEETGVSTQGDYLRNSCSEYTVQANILGREPNYYYNINYSFVYLTTAEQEQILSEHIHDVFDELGVSNSVSDYETVKIIYDYICENVVYDYTNLDNNNYLLKYSAYAALVDGTAVCQGYASLLYRMLTEAGISTRIIPGIGNGGEHAWNIVEIDGMYYNVDATWDAEYVKYGSEYKYFLKGQTDFTDHVRDDEYSTNEFETRYPMSNVSYGEVRVVASGNCGSGLSWSLDSNGMLTISGTGKMYSYSETAKAPWEEYRDSIKTLAIQKGVSSIGAYAFCGCSNLGKVTVAASLIEIGEYAFCDCIQLSEFIFMGNSADLGASAFENTYVTIYYPKCGTGWDAVSSEVWDETITWSGYEHVEEESICVLCDALLIAYGNINGDGEIDALDANIIYSYYNEVQNIVFTTAQIRAADVNGDGEVDALDANLVYAYYNEIIASLPI